MDGRETLNPKRVSGYETFSIQTLKGVGECETLNSKRSEWLRNPHTLKGVGGCETPNPKGSGWVRNPKP